MTQRISFEYTGSNSPVLRDCTIGKTYYGSRLEVGGPCPGYPYLELDSPGVYFMDDVGDAMAARIDYGGIGNIKEVEE